MAGRGPQTFKKRQKEQQRKERQTEKIAKRLQRKQESAAGGGDKVWQEDAPLEEPAAAADLNPENGG